MKVQNKPMRINDLLQQVDEAFGCSWRAMGCSNPENPTLIEMCEVFYMNGCHDGASGDVETFGHFYRIDRWIVWTDNYGFHDVEEFFNEDSARKTFEQYDADYARTFDTEEECF